MNPVTLVFIFAAVSIAPAWGAEQWQGRWSIDPIGCTIDGDTAETAPLIATQTTLRWFVAYCRIGKLYKTGAGVHIQAHCSAEGENYTIPVTLNPRGDRLRVTWDRGGVKEMRRCR